MTTAMARCFAMGAAPLLLAILGCTRNPGATVKTGFGEEDITPQTGMSMAGFSARKGVSTGTHDPLHVRTLVIEGRGGETVALMSVSLVGLNEALRGEIRGRIQKETGIPPKNILISATHTHSGPQIGKADGSYARMLADRSVASAVVAWKNRAPARIGTGKAPADDVGVNRRRLLYGGTHPDPEAGIIKVEDPGGRLRGIAFNYGCHPATLDWRNLEYTEDWPYYAIQSLKGKLGNNTWVSFYQSAEGDINTGYYSELSAIGADIPTRNWAFAERKGRQMASDVMAVLPSIPTSGDLDVEAVSDRCALPLRTHFAGTLAESEQKAAAAKRRLAELEARVQKGESAGRRTVEMARADAFLAELNASTARWFYGPKREQSLDVELQALRIGDAVFVSFPGEVFSEVGLALKRQSPFPKTFVIGLAGGGGYMPTAEEFPEGGYEVVGSHYSENAADVLVKSSLSLIHRLKGAGAPESR